MTVELYRSHSAKGAALPTMWRQNVKSKYKAAIIAAHLPGVHAVTHSYALDLEAKASAILAEAHGSKSWSESAHPRIVLEAGSFTDYYVYLVADAPAHNGSSKVKGRAAKREAREESAMAAAASIEFGRRSYVNRLGVHIPAWEGVRPLSRAMGMLL